MKKLFLLLLIALPMMVACGDDDENGSGGKEEPVYLNSARLWGAWYRINYSDSLVYIFDHDNKMYYKQYNWYTGSLNDDKDFGIYRITETEIFTQSIRRYYILDKDTLWIRASNSNYMKYIKVKNRAAS